MRNNLLRGLRVCLHSAVGALFLLSLPGTSAADNAHRAAYMTAVFTPAVQVQTITWWRSDGSLLLRSSSLRFSPLALDDLAYNHRSRFRPGVESVDVTLLYRLTEVISLYGRGWLFSALQPGALTPRAAKFGLDFASPWLFLDHRLQPIGAAELQSQKDYGWSTDFSLRVGLRWHDSRTPDRVLSLMLEGFVGNSQSAIPGAQQKVDYLGLGFHYAW